MANDIPIQATNRERFEQERYLPSAVGKNWEWFLQDDRYSNWITAKNENQRILWVRGDPGTGKSTLIKYLLTQRRPDHLVCHVFHKSDGIGSSATELYISLFLQLRNIATGTADCQHNIENFKPLLEVIHTINGTVICYIDAVNDLSIEEVTSFMEQLSKIEKVRVLLTSRHPVQLKRFLEVDLDDEIEHRNNLQRYVNDSLCKRADPSREEVCEKIVNEARGNFAMAKRRLDQINELNDTGCWHQVKSWLDDNDTLEFSLARLGISQ